MKPYAVSVTIGEKVSGKEFDTESEFKAFLDKAEELKKKAPTLLVTILRNGLPKKKSIPTVKQDPRKEESLCWQPAYRDGVPMVDYNGVQLYNCVPAPTKPKVMYCPYCNAYKSWIKITSEHDLEYKGCETCEMSDQDFYVKTANNLWKVV